MRAIIAFIVFLEIFSLEIAAEEGQAPQKERGLVGYWKFDENGGNVAKDSSGCGNDGIIEGAVWAKGKIGSCLLFEKDRAFVNCGGGASLNITAAITMMVWVNVANTSRCGSIVCRGNRNGRSMAYELFLSPGNPTTLSIGNGATYENITCSVPETGQWLQLAFTFKEGVARIFKNGRLHGIGKFNSVASIWNAPNVPTIIGAYNIGEAFSFKGCIDEVRIYNRALSKEEIKAAYEAVLSVSK